MENPIVLIIAGVFSLIFMLTMTVSMLRWMKHSNKITSLDVFVDRKEQLEGHDLSKGKSTTAYKVYFTYADQWNNPKEISFFVKEKQFMEIPVKTSGQLTFRGELPLAFENESVKVQF